MCIYNMSHNADVRERYERYTQRHTYCHKIIMGTCKFCQWYLNLKFISMGFRQEQFSTLLFSQQFRSQKHNFYMLLNFLSSERKKEMILQLAVSQPIPAYHFSMYCCFMPFQFDESIFLSFLCTPGFAWLFFFLNVYFSWHFIPFILLSSPVPFQMNPSDAEEKHSELNLSYYRQHWLAFSTINH